MTGLIYGLTEITSSKRRGLRINRINVVKTAGEKQPRLQNTRLSRHRREKNLQLSVTKINIPDDDAIE